jgi:hypothetical protein
MGHLSQQEREHIALAIALLKKAMHVDGHIVSDAITGRLLSVEDLCVDGSPDPNNAPCVAGVPPTFATPIGLDLKRYSPCGGIVMFYGGYTHVLWRQAARHPRPT